MGLEPSRVLMAREPGLSSHCTKARPIVRLELFTESPGQRIIGRPRGNGCALMNPIRTGKDWQ